MKRYDIYHDDFFYEGMHAFDAETGNDANINVADTEWVVATEADTEIARLRRKVAYYIQEARRWRAQADAWASECGQSPFPKLVWIDSRFTTIQQEPTEGQDEVPSS